MVGEYAARMHGDNSQLAAERRKRFTLTTVWLAAIACLALVRYRGEVGFYRRLHVWAAESGMASWARNLDTEMWFVVLGVGIWGLMRYLGQGPRHSMGLLDDLGLKRGLWRGVAVGVAICLPMLALGAITGEVRFEPRMIRMGVIGPFVEEWFFRGVLVLALVRLTGVSFWAAAIVGGLLFGAVHVNPWSVDGFASGWPHLLVTGVGGVWFAWMARSWGRTLWVAVTAHALMNLASPWYRGETGAAGSNVAFEVGRALTIALGTTMTIHPRWFRMGWARDGRRGQALSSTDRDEHLATTRS